MRTECFVACVCTFYVIITVFEDVGHNDAGIERSSEENSD